MIQLLSALVAFLTLRTEFAPLFFACELIPIFVLTSLTRSITLGAGFVQRIAVLALLASSVTLRTNLTIVVVLDFACSIFSTRRTDVSVV